MRLHGCVFVSLADALTSPHSGQLELVEPLDALIARVSTVQPPPGLSKKPPVEIIEGGFVYRKKTFNLSGKPLQILQALISAKDFRISAQDLQQTIWEDTETGLETVRNAVSDARKALRDAAKSQGVELKDPIPCVDRGKNLAWSLDLSA